MPGLRTLGARITDMGEPAHRAPTRQSYCCDRCGNHVHPMAGTIYEKSSTPLRLWFYAIFLMASTRCGISAKQLERELGVTYKTAWRMFKQIRSMLAENGIGPCRDRGDGRNLRRWQGLLEARIQAPARRSRRRVQ